ncbi:MAG: hypothetical protein R2681_00600 [Pyrinomonadaceae bacterium]
MKQKKKRRSPKRKSKAAGEISIIEDAERSVLAGKLEEAIAGFKRISENSQNFGRASKGLGGALLRSGRLSEALPVLQNAHIALPHDPEILVNGADVARMMGRLDVAEETYQAARKLGAEGYQIRFGEASILLERKHWLKAVINWEKMDEDFPGNHFVLHNLGRAWHELGETDKAVSYMKRALEIGGEIMTLSTLALLGPHAGSLGHDEIRSFRARLCERLSILEPQPVTRGVSTKSDGRINIGYVSAFFHRRNWMKPVWALLNNHDREKFCVHLFADGPPDEIEAAGGYKSDKRDKVFDTRRISNGELSGLIKEQDIDVLVDLNSYSAMPRLGLWTAAPAPVTVGWFNLYATSGMKGIDWLIGDEIVIKSEEEVFYTEKIMRLNQSYLTFQVGYDTPDIESPDGAAPFTFGCLGSGYKITPEVRAAWIRILKQTSETRLVVRNRILGDEQHKQWFLRFFTNEGIDPERIILMGPARHTEFLKTYGMIDLALDTFPYNGGTTTMESLWQGVPLVCFKGDRWVSRTSATLMHSAGFDEFIGSDENEYVEIAVNCSKAGGRDNLNELRSQMRHRLENSAVCDGAGLARDFERIISEIIK